MRQMIIASWRSHLVTLTLGIITGVVSREVALRLRRRRAATCQDKDVDDDDDGNLLVDGLCKCGAQIGHLPTSERRIHYHGARHAANMRRGGRVGGVGYTVCEDVSEYRGAARDSNIVVPGLSLVLELGCCTGGTTRVLLAQGPQALIASDKAPDLVRQTERTLGTATGTSRKVFIPLDAYDTRVVKRAVDEHLLQASSGCHQNRDLVLFVDVNGSKPLPPLFHLLDCLEMALKPRHIVVKSNLLKRFMMRSELWIHRVSQKA